MSNLEEYLENLCKENIGIGAIIVVGNEGLPIASFVDKNIDRTLIAAISAALRWIGRQFVGEIIADNLKRILIDCSDGAILIQPLNHYGILIASCKSATVFNELDIEFIQSFFSPNPPDSVNSIIM
jgi:predicted regulator of Ras-like GTPase activity (Roadblock/LC7/MglB family)